MQHGQVVFRTFLPANQYPPKTVQPTMCPLNHPAAGPESGLITQGLGLFTTRPNMQRVLKLLGKCCHFVTDITCVQTQVLSMIRSHLRSFDRYAHQCRFHQAQVIALRLSDPPEGRNGWTLRLLAEKVVELEIVPAISRTTVQETLKKIKSQNENCSIG